MLLMSAAMGVRRGGKTGISPPVISD